MRQLRFIFVALVTSLLVLNTALLRTTIAVLLCGILGTNSVSGYSFLGQNVKAESAPSVPNPAPPPNTSIGSSNSSNSQYNFNLVAKAGMVVDGQTLADPGATASGLKWIDGHFQGTYTRRLIDDKGRIAYNDSGRIFLDDKAVAFKGKQVGNFVINEVDNHFLFKNGTLDILADAFDTQSQRNSKILIRNGKLLTTFAKSLSISPQMYPECTLNLNEPDCTANAYYLYAFYKNYFRFDADGFKEVSIQEAEKRMLSPVVAFQETTKNRSQCIGNTKNQVICSLTDPSRLLVRDDGKIFPSVCCDYTLNNNGKILTLNELKVLDYNKDAIPANSKISRKDLEVALELHGLKIPYDTLLDIPKNVDWKYLRHVAAKISDNGDIAIIVQQQLGNPYVDKNKTFFASAIIRATPSGSAIGKLEPDQCPDTTIKPTDDAKAIVEKFRKKFASETPENCRSKSPWKGINTPEDAKAIADRLKKLIDDPSLIDQGQLSVCGPAAFFYLWFKRDPRAATIYATELYENGKSKIGQIDVTPKHLLESGNYDKGKDDMPAADWMMLGALRDSQNKNPLTPSFLGTPEDEVSAATLPGEIRDWLSATKLYSNVYSYIIPKKVSQSPNPSRKDEEVDWKQLIHDFSTIEDKDVVLLVNSAIVLSGTHYLIPIPNHYIVLTSPIKETTEGKVEFSYWSGGTKYPAQTFPKSFLEHITAEIAKKS